jgi:hypothetical protein
MTPRAARSISRKIYKRPRPKLPKLHRSVFGPEIPWVVEEVSGSDDDDDGQQKQTRPSSSNLTPQQTADLLLTQPPVVGVQASVVVADGAAPREDNDDNDDNDDDDDTTTLARSKLACDAGITLGFLAEAANLLLRDSKRLPSGGGGGGDSSGKLDGGNGKGKQELVVVFRAIVSFCAQTDGAPRVRGGTRFVTSVE